MLEYVTPGAHNHLYRQKHQDNSIISRAHQYFSTDDLGPNTTVACYDERMLHAKSFPFMQQAFHLRRM